jgi:hypothetical protein
MFFSHKTKQNSISRLISQNNHQPNSRYYQDLVELENKGKVAQASEANLESETTKRVRNSYMNSKPKCRYDVNQNMKALHLHVTEPNTEQRKFVFIHQGHSETQQNHQLPRINLKAKLNELF